MFQVPDNPVIRNMEATGYPDGKDPGFPVCPKCGEETDSFYVSADNEVLGCDNCVKIRDAWELIDDDEEYDPYE